MKNAINKKMSLIVSDVRVELTDEFDKNFERKRFFTDAPWASTKRPVKKGSLMLRSGALRSSITSKVQDARIEFSSDRPYAEIHNEGGTISMPARKQVLHFNKKGRFAKNNKRAFMAQKADVGAHTINIPQRQFIGDHPVVDEKIEEIVDEHMPSLVHDILKEFRSKYK